MQGSRREAFVSMGLKGVRSEQMLRGTAYTVKRGTLGPEWQMTMWSSINDFWGVSDLKDPLKARGPSSHF